MKLSEIHDPRNSSQRRKDGNRQNTITRLLGLIDKRKKAGEKAKTSLPLAKMMDNVYGSEFVKLYHSGEE